MFVVVSMTTVPARNGTLGPAIESLLRQTRPPDRIRLHLVPGCEAPAGVECVRVDDHGPATKIRAAIDPDVPEGALVVTADDDIVYGREWLATLVAAAERRPGEAVGLSGWNAAGFLAGEPGPAYRFAPEGSACDVLEGFCGVAYRKGFFSADVLPPSAAFRLVDDVWISSYLRRRGIVRRVVGQPWALCQAAHGLPGLHDRPDFVELNRRAALLGFGPCP